MPRQKARVGSETLVTLKNDGSEEMTLLRMKLADQTMRKFQG